MKKQSASLIAKLLNKNSQPQAGPETATVQEKIVLRDARELVPNPKNKDYSMDNIEELAAMIQITHRVDPITVRELPDGRFMVISGHRRRLAQLYRYEHGMSDTADLPTVVQSMVNDFTEADTEILRYRKVKQKNQEYYQLVLSKTPFYAEMGGQVGDSGVLKSDNETIEIIDTKKENNLAVHIAKNLPTDVTEVFTAVIDVEKRKATECNHSATHLLHEALREVLGTHVEQKGSYVSPESLRFDFSHFQKVTPEELRTLEHMVNKRIRENVLLDEHRNVPIAEAKNMGAMALFGEKYGDSVRVIKYGSSVELCGGTHVKATGNIGMLRIVSESSIAAGIRRIEAVTGENAEILVDNLQDMQRAVQELFNNTPDIISAAKKSLEDNSIWKKKVEDFKRMTGWTGRTNEHARDAAMLVFKRYWKA